jgi:hypothetical protein
MKFYLFNRATNQFLISRLGGVCHHSNLPDLNDGWDTAEEAARASMAPGFNHLTVKPYPLPEPPKAPVTEVAGCVPHGSPYLNDKGQMETVFAAWGCSEPLPRKGKAVFINFAPHEDNCLAIVKVHPAKSTYGKTLYNVQMYRRVAA